MDNGSPRVWMRGIHKVYPDGTTALRGVDFQLHAGEIVGLLGENGAGKTTLMKILSGLLRPTRGEILVDGRIVQFRNPKDALRCGIGMVHQVFTLVPPFTALQNVLLGREETGILRPLPEDAARRRIERMLEETGLSVPLDVPVESLPIGVQQRVEICKTLYRGTSVLILDEPTSALTPGEVEELFRFLRRLRGSGGAIVLITHKLQEVLEITDRVVVLRQGVVAGELPTREATPEKLVELMVGPLPTFRVRRTPGAPGRPVLTVRGVRVRNDQGRVAVHDLSFEVREGEIFGIAGVEGNGQSELVQALTGLRPLEAGEIRLEDQEVPRQDPLALYRRGLAHVPEDRARFGLALGFDLVENSILGRQREPQFLGFLGRLNRPAILRYAQELVRRFHVVAPDLATPVRSLSGGNQQRLLVGRELSKEPKLVVAMHPTRGLDVASTVYIRELLIQMRDAGKAVLLVSADLDEVLELSDRLAVMYEGRFLGLGPTEAFPRETIGLLMGGVVRTGTDADTARAPSPR
ncbi:MAG: ABC transporter ATP-binding protein [Armatimonadota bacterium]|nr:ABC transporter ATP-binding protein [Armatimonadota bacterium]MDR7440044.1 ABC transporter ATP-binding protein [Armatimonadota bacterium]MDR7562485.1 ABC transporter ATP-binding protein [Armatimonadota bacterium]MDR7566816.1 ABC transporter ATP-binding protein [Armatimonadota bacterium]MDR7601424.1 ABC transporter ATP-binding protein [Armatimonadota bacterium]